jgi:hypothetical protein
MKPLRRILSSWKGLAAGLVALTIYLLLPPVIRLYDPTAGVFDAGYLQWVGLATFLAFWAGFVGWVLFQLLFASLDAASANTKDEWGNLKTWFNDLSDGQRWCAVQGAYVLCVLLFIACLKLVPL